MRYHFAADFTVEPCSFGGHCPADRHFSTKPHADAHYAGLKAAAEKTPRLPIADVSSHELYRTLSAISSNEGQPLGYREPASRLLISGEKLLELAQKGYLNGELITQASIRDGVVTESAPALTTSEQIIVFGGRRNFIPLTLTLSKAGRELLLKLNAEREAQRAAESQLYWLETFGAEVDELKGQMARLLLQKSELPKLRRDLWHRAEKILRADCGQLWTHRKLSTTLGLSRQAASDTAQKLVARGLFDEQQVHDASTGRYLKGYRFQGSAITLLGGLEQAIGPKPE